MEKVVKMNAQNNIFTVFEEMEQIYYEQGVNSYDD